MPDDYFEADFGAAWRKLNLITTIVAGDESEGIHWEYEVGRDSLRP